MPDLGSQVSPDSILETGLNSRSALRLMDSKLLPWTEARSSGLTSGRVQQCLCLT